MPSLNLLVVGEEKALPDFEEALETCKRYVGPIKLFTAHKAVDAVSRLQKLVQTCGQCHAAFLDHHFTCPGKEEFSETLRKVIKEKHPDVPVICWGNPKKGGELNKHYHATLDFSKHGGDVNAMVDILKQVQAGQIRPEYLHKDQRKSLERRNSLDRSDSIRGGVPRTDSILRRADSRRASTEGSRPPPALDRVASSRRSIDEDAMSPAAGVGMASNPTLRRKSMERKGSLEGHGMAGPGLGMGMAGMQMGSMNAGMGMGMSMGSINSGMGMGMGMGNLSPTMGSMNAGMGMAAMQNGAAGMGMGGPGKGMAGGLGSNAVMGMGMAGVPAGLTTMSSMSGFNGVNGLPGADLSNMMGGMSLGGGVPAAAGAPAPAPAGGANPSPNAELIRMLAEEVVRLRKAVEEKRTRDAEAAQLRELQQQQMLLQQQLAAVNAARASVGGGMPMGI